MGCPECDSIDIIKLKYDRFEGIYPNVKFLDVFIKCKSCGYDWNCVGSKKINTSDSDV